MAKIISQQLEACGLKLKAADVAIVDATIIKSNARPRTVIEPTDKQEYRKELSADTDSTWLKKGKHYFFGYRGFARSDGEGFIDKTYVIPSNSAETKELDCMTDGLSPGVRVQADEGFFSEKNKEMLKSQNLKNGLMYKAFLNKPLTSRMTRFNKLISRSRRRIEKCFGTIKRLFKYQKASYFGRAKVNGEFMMKAMCLNLLKAVNKISFT